MDKKFVINVSVALDALCLVKENVQIEKEAVWTLLSNDMANEDFIEALTEDIEDEKLRDDFAEAICSAKSDLYEKYIYVDKKNIEVDYDETDILESRLVTYCVPCVVDAEGLAKELLPADKAQAVLAAI